MSSHNHMPPVPPANRSPTGPCEVRSLEGQGRVAREVNTAEQGDTANIRHNTTNKGFFQGRRVK